MLATVFLATTVASWRCRPIFGVPALYLISAFTPSRNANRRRRSVIASGRAAIGGAPAASCNKLFLSGVIAASTRIARLDAI